MHDLPGTDPRFHESRNYLSPVKYRGREILGAHGSCKEEGCGYRSAWTSQRARNEGMWLHRALKVREARALYFAKLFPEPGDLRVAQLFNETADNNSHHYEPWKKLVEDLFFNLLGDDAEKVLPDFDYYKEYKDGKSALDTAKFIFEAALR